MKKKALVLASCVAFATPAISIAQALPDNLAGLNLGDISASSYLDQPFRGVVPFLFTSVKDTHQLSVRLAPQSVFNKIGAEKLPILNNLRFQISTKSNKPVILISSSNPIQLPFLNFVLEIEGPNGVLYQDYTVLLDPKGYKPETVQQQPVLFEMPDAVTSAVDNRVSENEVSNNDLPITYSSTSVVTNQPKNYKIKSGDSLSRIAKRHKPNDISLQKMMQLVFDKNPKAFIRGDIDRIKRGVVLNLPTHKELTGLDNIAKEVKFKGTTPKVVESAVTKGQYKVGKGDSLSKITKKFVNKDTSFTKMMNAIFTANPDAFVSKNKNKLKAGVTLTIPSLEKITTPIAKVVSIKSTTVKTPTVNSTEITTKPISIEPINSETAVIPSEKTVSDVEKATVLPFDLLSISTSNKTQADKPTTAPLKPEEYRVKEGDTLTKITKEIGYKNVSFTKMMKAIYSENIHAFEKNNITKLKVGAVLALPKISDIDSNISNSIKVEEVNIEKLVDQSLDADNNTNNKIIEASVNEPIESAVVTSVKTKALKSPETNSSLITALDTSDLEKRIRELRAELDQAKSGLSNMKSELNTKDTLILEKDNQLVGLKSSLIKLKIKQTAIDQITKEELESEELAPEDIIEEDKLYGDSSTAKPAQLAALKLLRHSTEDNSKNGFNHMLSSAVKQYYDNSSPKSLAYISMALILGLLLIRYRREIYSYTAINFDHPKYYPVPGIDEYQLKERNISFQDPIKEKNPEEEYFEQIQQDTKSELYHEPVNEFSQEVTKNIHDNSHKEPYEEESEEIEHCEHLVTELFNDFNSSTSSKTEVSIADNEWLGIEKICDDYIENRLEHPQDNVTDMSEIKSSIEHEQAPTDIADAIDFKEVNSSSDVTDFDEMMSDLLTSLDGVEKSINNNSALKRNKNPSNTDSPEKLT